MSDITSNPTSPTPPAFFPFLRYHDAPRAIDWLSDAFGFEKQLVVPGPDDTIAHAQLRLGDGVILLSSVKTDDLGLASPRQLGAVSQGVFVAIDEVDAHYDRARSSGAEIVFELQDMDYGSREYAARDLEGHLWCFGTFRPGEPS